jgi:hypothetical protein
MDQKPIMLTLAKKGLSAVEIHADLVVTLRPELVGDPSVTYDFRQAKFSTSKPSFIFSEPDPEVNDSDEASLRA